MCFPPEDEMTTLAVGGTKPEGFGALVRLNLLATPLSSGFRGSP
jgi:hypothetical protein